MTLVYIHETSKNMIHTEIRSESDVGPQLPIHRDTVLADVGISLRDGLESWVRRSIADDSERDGDVRKVDLHLEIVPQSGLSRAPVQIDRGERRQAAEEVLR